MEVITNSPPTKHLFTILTFVSLLNLTSASNLDFQIPKRFINKSCNATTYPPLCVKTLGPYASVVGTSPLKLCNAALAVAIQAASNCSATVSKESAYQKGFAPAEAGAVKDCIGDMKDAVDELKQTVNAMAHLGDADREFQWDNAKTYASAAITDAETCIDGFLDNKESLRVKKKIRGCVDGVEKLISNALSLINHLY